METGIGYIWYWIGWENQGEFGEFDWEQGMCLDPSESCLRIPNPPGDWSTEL